MDLYIVRRVKKECFKFGGMFYINRVTDVNSTKSEERDFRKLASMLKQNKDITGESIGDPLKTAGLIFDSMRGLTSEFFTEKEGTDLNPLAKIDDLRKKGLNTFDGMGLVLGDEVIFLPFFGYYQNDLFDENELDYSLIVLKTDNLRVGFLVPEKVLSDYMEIEKQIRPLGGVK